MKNERYVLAKTTRGLALQWVEEALPQPGVGEVRVKIVAAGVAFSDLLRLRGLYSADVPLPYTPGWDMAGEVDAIGPGVVGLSPGQPVVALTGTGNFARYRTLPAGEAIPQPAGLDPAQAVSLCLNYVTAYQMLHRFAGTQAGESMLVHSAAGGVGTAALQLGRLAGLRLYGVASQGHLETVTRQGAVAIDRTTEDFLTRASAVPEGGMDIVLDPIGGATLVRSFRALRPGGRLMSYGLAGMMALPRAAVPFAFLQHFLRIWLWNRRSGGRRVRFYNIGAVRKRHPDWIREDLARLLDWLRNAQIAPLIAQRLPLREAPRALELIAAGNVQGKLVLMCQK